MMKTKIKHILFKILGWFLNLNLTRKFSKFFMSDDFSVRALCYHDVPEKSLGSFERQIIFLKKEYKIITPEQFSDFFTGRGFLPGLNIFITLDDGSEDQYKAAEILDKYGVKACFFVNTDNLGGSIVTARPGSNLRPLNWEQVKNLKSRGHLIGSHGAGHFNFSKLQPYEISRELAGSKNDLKLKLNSDIDFFAFPYGTRKDISREALILAKDNYKFVFSAVGSKNVFSLAPRQLIERTGVRPEYSLNHLRAIIAGARDIFYKREFKDLNV